MKRSRSYLGAMVLLAFTGALSLTCSQSIYHALHSGGSAMERLIESDREHFRSMQSVWDKMEDENPEFVRPAPTTEEEYQRWREESRKVK